MNFPSPVAIQPNTTYVAAYFAPNGHYSHRRVCDQPPARRPGPTSSTARLCTSCPTTGTATASTNTRERQHLPAEHIPVRELLGRRDLHPDRAVPAAGSGDERQRHGGSPAGDGQLDRRRRPAVQRTSYRITPYIGATAQTPTTVTAPASSKTITGLTGGTTYTFTVTADQRKRQRARVRSVERGDPDDPEPARRPDRGLRPAPALQATVNWTAPASDGGSPITSYRITPYVGSSPQTPTTVSAPASSTTVTGLAGGTSYTFKVAAINAAGTGQDSAPSNAVTPTTPNAPGAPTGVTASPVGFRRRSVGPRPRATAAPRSPATSSPPSSEPPRKRRPRSPRPKRRRRSQA